MCSSWLCTTSSKRFVKKRAIRLDGSLFVGSSICSFQGWKEPKIPGGRRNRTGGQPPGPPCRLTPGPPLRGTLPGRWFRASGAGRAGDCFPFRAAAAGRAKGSGPSGWTRKARLVPAAVGAGLLSAGGETPPLRRGWVFRCRGGLWPPVHCQTKQHGTSQADPVGAPGPNFCRARAQWPGRGAGGHSGFARRKGQIAKGAPPKTAFWFLCRRGQRNPPPGRRNSPFAWVCLSERSERHERIAGGRRNRTGGQPPGPPCRLSPGPPYGGRFPGNCSAHPARAGQGFAFRSAPLPLAGQFRESRPAGPGKRAWCKQP